MNTCREIFEGLNGNTGSPKSVMLANDLLNTVEIRIAVFPKAVTKYQGKHLPRNTPTLLQEYATKKSPYEIMNWVQLNSVAISFLLLTTIP